MDKQGVLNRLDALAGEMNALSDAIWDHPEMAFDEHFAMQAQCDMLEKHGFTVTRGFGDVATAFSGRFGTGHPVIGLLGEFDALSGLSQQADTFEKASVAPGAPGHGCGHNLLGAGSLAAAVAVKEYLEASGKPGTVIYYGCPGEEGGSGKAFMARDGVFDELDCALTWHPGDMNVTANVSLLANYQIAYRFKGVSSHAAASPHLGRSALDAVELMNVGVQFLREHIIPEARIHYAITDAGGASPNVVQPTAEVLYLIRAPKTPQVKEIYERVNKIAQGAAMMTETEVEIQFIKACSNVIPNGVLNERLQANMESVPQPEFTAEDAAYAQSVQATFEQKSGGVSPVIEKAAALFPPEQREMLLKAMAKPIRDFVIPYIKYEQLMPGSSDVGDVSWVCPTSQISAVTQATGTPGHSWQLVAQGKSDLAHKGTLYAAKVLAGSVIDLLEQPELVEKAKAELSQRLGGGKYEPPIPKDVKPTVMGGGIE